METTPRNANVCVVIDPFDVYAIAGANLIVGFLAGRFARVPPHFGVPYGRPERFTARGAALAGEAETTGTDDGPRA